MSLETLFSICNATALIGWLLLVLFPQWRFSARLVTSVLIPALLTLVYLFLMVWYFKGAQGGFGSLSDVSRLFEHPPLLMAGWIHYLAFDLFIGSWEVRDSQKKQIAYWVVLPCLLLTFLFGPIGLVCYMGARALKTKRLLLDD